MLGKKSEMAISSFDSVSNSESMGSKVRMTFFQTGSDLIIH